MRDFEGDELNEFMAEGRLVGMRGNRSVEHDTPDGTDASFLEKEILPEVGKRVNLTGDPEMRAICGNSSGGIGSFTNIRGGYHCPYLIRKTEKKPIRVFLQDGSGDLDNARGNWWLANQQKEAALKFSKWDYKAVWGEGGHNGMQGGAIFPDTL